MVLKANDGSVDITGELLSFEDGFYTIRSVLGDMRISAARMSCEGAGCPQIDVSGADIVVAGSDTLGEGLMPLLLTGYASSLGGEAEARTGNDDTQAIVELTADGGFGDPMGSFLITSTSSSSAFEALLAKRAEIGMSSRRITPPEARSLRDSGAGNMVDIQQEHVVAVDSLLIIVHPDNPIDTIALADLAGIYTGRITNWSELGGPDAPITAYGLTEDSGTRNVFESRVLGEAQAQGGFTMRVVDSNNDMAAAVNGDPGGIGYAGYAFQRGAKSLSVVSECGITARPDAFSAKTEDYPLQRRLYLYNRADELSERSEDFLNYAISARADGVVAKSGFIDLGVARVSQDDTSGRMRDLIQNTRDAYELTLMRDLLVEMLSWDRLSTTFRFASGSSQLDNKARLDMARLIDYLENQPAGTRVALVGFTDGDGAFEANRALSVGRAQQVAQELNAVAGGRLNHLEFEAKGFGELSPSACNETIEGRRINRRVEVWIQS